MDLCETQTYHFEDDGSIPNNRLPLVVYRYCITQDEPGLRQLLESHGWGDTWVNGVYDYHHYHSSAHEFLGVLNGKATLQLGGEDGKVLDVSRGDVLIIPAGVGHRCIEAGPLFSVLGAYPDGQSWDLRKGKPADRPEVIENIAKLPFPKMDPIYGEKGPLKCLWQG